MIIEYPSNTQYMRYEYHRVREGPNYFVSYYKNSSQLHYDPKNCWRTLGVAKFTDTGKSLKSWCLEMDEMYNKEIKKGNVDTSFASDIEDQSPTKMVT